jgi:hypothetical protein
MNNKNITLYQTVILVSVMLILAFTSYNLDHSLSTMNQITGDVVSTVNVSPMRERACNFTLESGLNLVSFFCISFETSRSYVLQNISNLYAIYEYEENAIDKWRVYNPSLPAWVIQDLNTMSRTEGYWIAMNSTSNAYVSGALRTPTSIRLVPGWNLAGYPTNRSKPTNISFTTINGSFTEVRGFDQITKTFLSYIPPDQGGLTQLDPYEGYWINMTGIGVWIVD